jgi:hypothetical protein
MIILLDGQGRTRSSKATYILLSRAGFIIHMLIFRFRFFVWWSEI